MPRPYRILLGTVETSGFVPDLADGFRALGHEATTAMCIGRENFDHARYDLDIWEDTLQVDWREIGAWFEGRLPGVRPRRDGSSLARILWILRHHDVFVFLYGSLRHDWKRQYFPFRGIGREFPLLSRLGKRIVSCFIGPEVRDHAAFSQQACLLGHPLPQPDAFAPLPPHVPMLTLRRAERFSDVILSQPNQSALALRPYWHAFAPIRVRDIRCHVHGREVPLVVHAPSNSATKGTSRILEALHRLRSRGVAFELRLLQGVRNPVVMEALGEADVAVDQMHLPYYGRLGIEAMAAGCALATCNREDLEPVPAARPILHIDPVNVEEALRPLLEDREARIRQAWAARQYVERHHDHVAVARSILRLLDGHSPPDHYPVFFARHFNLPPEVQLPRSVQRLTAEVVRRWGVPEGVRVDDLVRRNLLPRKH